MSVPVELGRDDAAQLAREELAKQIYRDAGPGLVERAMRWLLEQAGNLLDDVAGASPGGWPGIVLLVVMLLVAAVAIRLRTGPLARQESADAALFAGRDRSSAEHRRAADAHAAAGEWALAVRERLRAVVRSLEERALIEPRPGRTADEAAAEAGLLLPSCADRLRAAARLFDDVWYGGRPAGPTADAELRDLDAAVQAARPAQPVGHQ